LASEVDIANMALAELGEAKITSLAQKADISLETLLDQSRDKTLEMHEWGFATKRTRLVASGLLDLSSRTVTITGNDAGTEDTIVLDATESFITAGFAQGDRVYITGSESNNGFWDISISTAVAALTLTINEDEAMVTEVLTSDADLKLYVSSAYGYDFKYAKPSDHIRTLNINDDIDIEFNEEGSYILTNEKDSHDEIDIKYIKQETDTTKFTPLFIEVMVLVLASKLAKPIKGDEASQTSLLVRARSALAQGIIANIGKNKRSDEQRSDTSWQSAGR